MTTTSKSNLDRRKNGKRLKHEDIELIEKLRRRARARKVLAARALAQRVQVLPDGRRVFVRFSRSQRIEHQVLIGSFSTLALTGLVQRYSQLTAIGLLINLMGGVETVRTLHHLAALVFVGLSLYHLYTILLVWFVKRERGAMWPRLKDFRDLLHMLKYNIGRADSRPEFDRFSIEEKIEYWALLWGGIVMGLTGFIQWFPIQATRFFPGEIVPISRAIHSWEAVLAVLAILIWHTYHVVIKECNTSIFTGFMTEEEMQETHPLEYRRILAACRYLEKIAAENAGTPQDGQGTPRKRAGAPPARAERSLREQPAFTAEAAYSGKGR